MMIGIGMPISHKRTPRMFMPPFGVRGVTCPMNGENVLSVPRQVETALVRRASSSNAAASSALV
jgi:hypothetical protein